MAAYLCGNGWHESYGMMVSENAGFLYMRNVMSNSVLLMGRFK